MAFQIRRTAGLTIAMFCWGAGFGSAQDSAVVQMDTLNVRDVLYHLGGGGGNGMALIDEVSPNGGVVLIDTKPPGWAEATREVIGQVTDLPIVTIINTHGHIEHAGSNAEFETVTQIIAHENTALRMATSGMYRPGEPGFPTTIFTDRYSLLEELDRIELYYFGRGHTDGDVVVVFPEKISGRDKGVAYLGDLFPMKGVPVIDTDNGGSGIDFPETLARVVSEIKGVSRVITGHGPFPSTYAGRGRRERGASRAWSGFYTWDDLAEYAEFVQKFVQSVEMAYDAGRSSEEIAENFSLPIEYAGYDVEHVRASISAIYNELNNRAR